MKPVIGITCNYTSRGDFAVAEGIGGEGQHWHLIARDYIAAIEANGGIPVILPIHEDLNNTIDLVSRLDGVLSSGGPDVNPLFFNEYPMENLGYVTPNRDRQELELTKYILTQTTLPYLGICRGAQILNIAFGGNVYQDHQSCGLAKHSILNIPMSEPSHFVQIQKDSLLYEIVQKEKIQVNSLHHQSVHKLGEKISIVATDDAGIIEAIEYNARNEFSMGVQWHPETLFSRYEDHNIIFKAFVNAAKTH